MEARWPGSAGFSGGEGLRPRLCYRCNTASRRQTFFCVRSQKPAGLFFRIGKIPEDKSGVCVHLPSSMGGSAETRGGERRKGTPRQMELTPLFLAATPASASGPERGFVSGSESESGFDPASRPASSRAAENVYRPGDLLCTMVQDVLGTEPFICAVARPQRLCGQRGGARSCLWPGNFESVDCISGCAPLPG